MKKLFLFLIALHLFAADKIGILNYKEGIVKIKHQNSIRKFSLNIGDQIFNKDEISTYNSIAEIILDDNSTIKLDKYSTIKFIDNNISQTSGKVYYKITKRKQKRLNVATIFTNIGVKGTTFIVTTTPQKVSLKEGIVNLKAIKGEYEIHTKRLLNQFELYKLNINEQFSQYKQNLYKEFIEYKKSFDLNPNYSVVFHGNKVYQEKLDIKEFEYFEKNFK